MKNQRFRIIITDKRTGGTEHEERFDDLSAFLTRAKQIANREDSHVAERTTAQFFLYPKKTIPGLFE